jgi:hypothetical protein
METQHISNHTKLGTLSGTLLSIAGNLNIHDVWRTALLACVGAVVSFMVSSLLKWLLERLKRSS